MTTPDGPDTDPKERMPRKTYLALAGCAMIALTGAVGVCVCESRLGRDRATVARTDSGITEREMLERRRGRMADVAIAVTTTP